MGVDVSHIVRHDFFELNDLDKARMFCEKTRDRLWSSLLLDSCVDEDKKGSVYYLDDEYGFAIRIPYHDIELELRSGCWEIESYYHYVQLVLGNHLRHLVFDIVHALEQTEAWHAAENYTWNGGPLDNPMCSFMEWYDFVKDKYGSGIQEFNSMCIGQYDKEDSLCYEPVYHDNFEECFEEFNQLQNKTDKYRLIGLTRVGNNMLRAEKNGELYLLREQDMRPIFHYPIRMENTFGPWIIIWKDNKSAIIDRTGNQLTPFVKGQFKITHESREVQCNGEKYKRYITCAENHEAKMKIILNEKIANWYDPF